VWKNWIRLKKEFATLGEKLPPAKLLFAKGQEESPDPKRARKQRGVWTKSTSRGYHVGS